MHLRLPHLTHCLARPAPPAPCKCPCHIPLPPCLSATRSTKRTRASAGGAARGAGGEERELEQLTVRAQSTPSVAAALAAKLAPNVTKLRGARSVGAMWQTWVSLGLGVGHAVHQR